MRKLSVLAVTAVTAMTISGLFPVTTQAAGKIVNIRQTKQDSCVNVKNFQNLDRLQEKCKEFGIIINKNQLDCPVISVPGNGTSNTQKPQTPNVPDQKPDQGDQVTESSYAREVVRLVNEERAKAGLSLVTLDQKVEKAAQVRAKEIVTAFSHTRPDGSSFSTALKENGVSYKGSGENIAWGQKTPAEVMKGWMNSPGHKANILNPNFKSIGVGHYQNGSGVNYWTQLFTY